MKRALIFGVGNNFIQHFNCLNENYDIVGLLDNAAEKAKQIIFGYPVMPFCQIDNLIYDIVIVTPNCYYEMIKQLIDYGIDTNKIVLLKDAVHSETEGGPILVGFLFQGGLGDFLIDANYMDYFRKRFSTCNMEIDLYCWNNFYAAASVFQNDNGIKNIYEYYKGMEKEFIQYDLFITLRRYPEINYIKTNKIIRVQPDLIDYYQLCEKYKIFNQRFFATGLNSDGHSAVICQYNKQKRIQQPDIGGYFSITEDYKYPLPIMTQEKDYLSDLHLEQGSYITLHRGGDVRFSCNGTRMWPIKYYNELIFMIKKKYPKIKIVQIGVSHSKCLDMEGTDCNLVEKTTLEQVKVLIKNSLLHIDNEGGMVHLRHALHGGPSVVVFGPTSSEFYGYEENTNITGPGCLHWCEWVTDDWRETCSRGFEEPPCMYSIKPQTVLEAVSPILDTALQQ